jgi:predicted dienelactone hydrolase
MRWILIFCGLLCGLLCGCTTPAPAVFDSYDDFYDAGFRVVQRIDQHRQRPLMLDWWYPVAPGQAEPYAYGLGRGRVAEAAEPLAGPFPLVLLSHGAFGAARNYSWLAEPLARAGFVVLGVSHYGESYVYGPDTVSPAAVLDASSRIADLQAALRLAGSDPVLGAHVDLRRVAVLGHSSGGASALLLAGMGLRPAKLAAYCRSPAAPADRGCDYAAQQPPAAGPVVAIPAQPRAALRAVVALDPALGPGLLASSGASAWPATLLIGARRNDFLPFAHHAGQVATLLPRGRTLWLDQGEGHFVFLNRCERPIEANGVPLCEDRAGVDRGAVHSRLVPAIRTFLGEALAPGRR